MSTLTLCIFLYFLADSDFKVIFYYFEAVELDGFFISLRSLIIVFHFILTADVYETYRV